MWSPVVGREEEMLQFLAAAKKNVSSLIKLACLIFTTCISNLEMSWAAEIWNIDYWLFLDTDITAGTYRLLHQIFHKLRDPNDGAPDSQLSSWAPS